MQENQIVQYDRRLPKQYGDFGEALVMLVLGRHKRMKVALVDHTGADIIATAADGSARYAVSVKSRNFSPRENKGYEFSRHNITMLQEFSDAFGLTPAVAFVFSDSIQGDEKIRVLICTLSTLASMAADGGCEYVIPSKNGGYHLNYGRNNRLGYDYLDDIRRRGDWDYTELTLSAADSALHI